MTLRGQYGLVRSNSRRDVLTRTITYYHPDDNSRMYWHDDPNTAAATDYTSNYQTFIGTAEYKRVLAKNHDITALLGVSQEKLVGTQFGASRQNVPIDLPALNLGAENIQNSASSNMNALQSLFGRA